MRLTRCYFEGLPGFPVLELKDMGAVTALIGPNGAGKSSILQVIGFAITLLNNETISDALPKHDVWQRFSIARLNFKCDEPGEITRLSEHFGTTFENVEFEIECDEKEYFLKKVTCDNNSIEFFKPASTRTKLIGMDSSLAQAADRLSEAQQQLNQAPENQRQKPQAKVTGLAQTHEKLKGELFNASTTLARISSSETEISIQRNEVDEFIQNFNIPKLAYVSARQSPEVAIPELIKELMILKKGRKPQSAEYRDAVKRLSHLLQADVDLSEVDGKEDLHIDGATYGKASSGTEISLAFFGLTRLGEPNCIVLWDEPENGLHPTRRSRLLELMFSDSRQFILATHASELAPVFTKRGSVYRCISEYDKEEYSIRLSVQRVADRREAFQALEALGVHPAKTLFTTNVVIWVEGPTELMFYRKWLKERLKSRGVTEGFHYTFMQYGGSLISYLSAIDETQFESFFDLLSLCRHPVVLVDSDLKVDPGQADVKSLLKPGARRLLSQIESLNSQRTGAALFRWTGGREVENYLPVSATLYAIKNLWVEARNFSEVLQEGALTIGRYEAYHEAIARHLIASGVVDDSEDSDEVRLPKGRSIWGSGNKVEMMRKALEMPDLSESQLIHGCTELLKDVEEFILAKCEPSERI